MIFSTQCEYAIRALTHLARSGRICQVREISQAQQAAYPFMAKVLQALRRKGFVRSVRGVHGGFWLAREAYNMRLIDVLTALDGDRLFRSCLYGFSGCSENAPCPLHDSWKSVRGEMEAYLRNLTIADLSEQKLAKKKQARQRKHSDR